MDEKMATFLRACVKARINILVSGGTGSGKTTTLNVISSFIPEGERIVGIVEYRDGTIIDVVRARA